MPTEVNKLRKESKPAQIKAAISDCIATEVRGGTEQKQAIAICHSQARKKTGKALAKK